MKISDDEYVEMKTDEYVLVLVPKKDIKKYIDKGWELKEKRVSGKLKRKVEKRLAKLFKMLAKRYIVYRAPYDKYEWYDFVEGFFQDYVEIEEVGSAVGALIEHEVSKITYGKEFHITFLQKGEDPEERYIEYQDIVDFLEERENLQKKKKQISWRPADMVYWDFKEGKGYIYYNSAQSRVGSIKIGKSSL